MAIQFSPGETLEYLEQQFYGAAETFRDAKELVQRKQAANHVNALLDAYLDIQSDILFGTLGGEVGA